MRKQKNPSYAERSAAAAAKAGAALSVFQLAAADLDEAAVEQAALEADLLAEAEALRARASELDDHAYAAFNAQVAYGEQASQIRALVGIN